MKDSLKTAMLEATRLTQAGRLADATALIQRTFGGLPDAADPSAVARAAEDSPVVIKGDARIAAEDERRGAGSEDVSRRSPGARFIAGSFTNPAGTRDYKLYVPGDGADGHSRWARSLIVMLHGCGQDPDDFALGTRMNQLADARGFLVLYPAQSLSANGSGCWNWFSEEDQQRDRGEPSIIAELTRQVMDSQGIDPQRVYVAGLSAGGAMAATLATAYPELYAAFAVHSGLPHAAARDMVSAVAAMRQGVIRAGWVPPPREGLARPAIVFHGDCDTTVHPANATQVIAQVRAEARGRGNPPSDSGVHVESGRIPGGYGFTRTCYEGMDGRAQAELWLVHGAGHGWLGGNAAGTYIEPRGPDASREMLRFFAEQP